MSVTKTGYDAPKVGGDILSYCGKCKLELAHVVIAMIDLEPKKVQCKTCRAEHRFRRSSGVTSTVRSSTRAKRPKKQVIRAADLWQQKLDSQDQDNVQPYKISADYTSGTVVNHPKFGIGFVEEVRTDNKILVFFRDGERVLIHRLVR